MLDQHLSRGIPIFLALAIFAFAGACNTTSPPATETTTPTATRPVSAAAVVPQPNEDLPFSSLGESFAHLTDQYDKEVRCRKGNGSKGAPMICIDNVSTRPDPYLAQVWDFEGEGGLKTDRPVVVHWFTRRTSRLEVVFQQSTDGQDCVSKPLCAGGHCSAIVRPLDGAAERYCRYNVLIDGARVESKSPGMSVIPCCW
jgi:hypothetical protein